MCPEVLVSRATSTVLAFEQVPTAVPICAASNGVKLSLTRPRTPELPNNLPIVFMFRYCGLSKEQDCLDI
jgi:hypothetical protein